MNLNPQKEKENLQLHEIQFLMIQYERISLKEIHFVFSVSVYLWNGFSGNSKVNAKMEFSKNIVLYLDVYYVSVFGIIF